jgi:hypothetical protein
VVACLGTGVACLGAGVVRQGVGRLACRCVWNPLYRWG